MYVSIDEYMLMVYKITKDFNANRTEKVQRSVTTNGIQQHKG